MVNFDLNSNELTDIKQNNDKIDHLLDDSYALNEEVKGLFGDEYDAKLYNGFTVTSTKTVELLKSEKNKIVQLIQQQKEKTCDEELACLTLEKDCVHALRMEKFF